MGDPVETVRSIFSQPLDMVLLSAEGDAGGERLLAAAATSDIEFEFVGPPENETAGVSALGAHHGRAEMLDAWREWLQAYSSYIVELREVHPLGELSVLAEVECTARTATGDVEMRQRQGALFEFRGDQICRWQAWLHADDAKAALGVRS